MLPNFTVLMSNVLEMGPYDDICHPDFTGPEMLIVQVLNDIVRISDAAKIDPSGADVLSNYRAMNSMYGICTKDEGASGPGFSARSSMQFLLVREIPAGAPVEGSFFPVDGCARVSVPRFFFSLATLTAEGRHDHGGSKRSWRFTAIQRPVVFQPIPLPWPIPAPGPFPDPWPGPLPWPNPWPNPWPEPWAAKGFEEQAARLASMFAEDMDPRELVAFTGKKIAAKGSRTAKKKKKKKS